jgi:hypothetical protein
MIKALGRRGEPNFRESRLTPVLGLNSHDQAIPVTMNEIAIGKRKMPRKKASALIFWSSSAAARNPSTDALRRKSPVKTIVFRMSAWKRGFVARAS